MHEISVSLRMLQTYVRKYSRYFTPCLGEYSCISRTEEHMKVHPSVKECATSAKSSDHGKVYVICESRATAASGLEEHRLARSSVDLPRIKRVEVGLTYLYGIGQTRATKICNETGIDKYSRQGPHRGRVLRFVTLLAHYTTGRSSPARRVIRYCRLGGNGCYRGLRHHKASLSRSAYTLTLVLVRVRSVRWAARSRRSS